MVALVVVLALVLVLANAAQVDGPDLSSDRHYDVVSEASGKVLAMNAVLVETVPAADMPAAPVDAAGVFIFGVLPPVTACGTLEMGIESTHG